MKTMIVIGSLLAMSFIANAKEKEIVVKMFPTRASFEKYLLWAYDFNVNGKVDPYERAVARWLLIGGRRPINNTPPVEKKKKSPISNDYYNQDKTINDQKIHVQGGNLQGSSKLK